MEARTLNKAGSSSLYWPHTSLAPHSLPWGSPTHNLFLLVSRGLRFVLTSSIVHIMHWWVSQSGWIIYDGCRAKTLLYWSCSWSVWSASPPGTSTGRSAFEGTVLMLHLACGQTCCFSILMLLSLNLDCTWEYLCQVFFFFCLFTFVSVHKTI